MQASGCSVQMTNFAPSSIYLSIYLALQGLQQQFARNLGPHFRGLQLHFLFADELKQHTKRTHPNQNTRNHPPQLDLLEIS